MVLFKISCDTCRTSLNVRKKSAIGQILACPKCGSMVQVQPPEDWSGESFSDPDSTTDNKSNKRPFVKPVPDPNLPETASTVSGSVTEGLKTESAHSNSSASSQDEKSNGDNRWQGQTEKAALVDTTKSLEPDLPNSQWDSARTKQRKKLLIAFTTAISLLVVGTIAVVIAAVQFASGDSTDGENSKPKQVAQNGKGPEDVPAKPADKKNDIDDATPGKKQNSTKSVDNVKEKAEPQKQSDLNPDVRPDGGTKSDNTSKSATNPEKGSTAKTVDRSKEKDKTGTADDTPPGFTDSSDDEEEGMLPGFFREIEEFAVIFEQDEPLLKLRQAFNESDLPGNYGLSRYFVSKSLKRSPDPDLALNVPLAKASFRQATLLEILDFFYEITGVPVSIDVTPVILAGVELDQKIDFEIASKTTREALEELANQLGLELVPGKNSLVFTIPDRDNLIEITYALDDIAANPDEIQQLIDQIKVFVNRRSWSENGGQGIITSNDKTQSMIVKHYGWAQVRIREFLRHYRYHHQAKVKNSNANLPVGEHRIQLVSDLKKRPVTLLHADPVELSNLFAQLAREFNIHVFVNWEATGESLEPTGSLPLSVENEPFGQFINELADGVRLELVWHASNVVELTTQIGKDSNLTFESYGIENAVSKRFSPDKLMKALRNLLVSNGLADFKRAELEVDQANQKAIYAVLPQSAHQNVLKILEAAKKVKPAK